MFLTDLDYTNHQKAIDLSILTEANNLSIRNFAENAAVEQIKSHLRRRFDVDEIFINVPTWNATTTYATDDHVFHSNVIYIALQNNLNQIPTGLAPNWEVGDNRDPFLVMIAVDITIYHLYAKIPNRKTPEDVNVRYGDALDWLKEVSTGKVIPNYPLLADDEANPSNVVKFGSQTKLNHRY